MFRHLKWPQIESAAKAISELEYVVLVIRVPHKNQLHRRKIDANKFKSSIWSLYDHKTLFREIAVLSPNGDVLYHHSSIGSDEGLPTSGNPDIILYWKNLAAAKRANLVNFLTTQIETAEYDTNLATLDKETSKFSEGQNCPETLS